ncbi:HD domain-containing phosphohydrolase [uncultured Mailhella sp.]|uniref:HD domain-containing phosphohydrolase n=1 Tax=uncultured Mailhella sp. TaxID=1981031 RepID=UPI0025E69945|nr:HD domain-containing phosphohydrolase [uncultured Mailhella sp.]
MMNSRENASYSGLSKRSTLLAAVGLALVSGGIALLACFSQLESRRLDVMQRFEQDVTAWLDGARRDVEIWNADMKKLRLRISESETYRLFSGDLFGLDSRVAGVINSAEQTGNLPGPAAVLSEEVPAIRRILLEFMNYNGLLDARLVNKNGQTILSAFSTPSPLSPEQNSAAQQTMKTGETSFLPVRGSVNGLALDVFEPVYDLDSPEKCVAVFMSSVPVLSKVTQFTARPKQNDMSTAAMVQRRGDVWEKMQVPSPVAVPAALGKELADHKGVLPFGLRESVSEGGGMVYSMSVFFPGLEWSLVHETPESVVEGMVFRAELPVYAVGVLAWISFMLLSGLLWWMGFGRQQRAVAAELRRLNQIISRQKELLDSVNLSLDVGLFMADVKGQIRVCNPALAAILGKDEKDVSEQMIFSCFPTDAATLLLDRIRQVAINNREEGCELYLERDGEKRLYRVTLFPFMDAGGESVRNSIRGAVVSMKDITEFRRQSLRMRQRQKSLIEAFTRAEESVDPYLAGHSQRMAKLGELLSVEMGLSEDGRNTVVMGAMLSQVGKLFIPRELLTKKGKLTPEELDQVHQAPEHAFRLMENVDFDLPIARALHEMYENMDGSGYPNHLKGEEILPEARVLGVLNAFCAMVSSRAYRKGMDERQAVEELMNNARFDQTVVNHLRNVLKTPEGMVAARS